MKLSTKEKFNAVQNAIHVFAYKEEGTKFKILDLIHTDESTKAVVVTSSGEVQGLFTDSPSATAALSEVFTIFGEEQPFITVNMKTTKKGASVYYVTIVD